MQINKLISKYRNTENSSWTIFHLQVVDYRVLWCWLFAFFVVLGSWIYTIQLYGELGLTSRNFVLKWKNTLALPFYNSHEIQTTTLSSHLLHFNSFKKYPQNNRNLFYFVNLAGIDHKTTMGRIAAASPTAEEQNKQSPSKPKITLHSPKHDIKSSFRSAGMQVLDQLVHGNVKTRVWGYLKPFILDCGSFMIIIHCWSSILWIENSLKIRNRDEFEDMVYRLYIIYIYLNVEWKKLLHWWWGGGGRE